MSGMICERCRKSDAAARGIGLPSLWHGKEPAVGMYRVIRLASKRETTERLCEDHRKSMESSYLYRIVEVPA